MRREEAAISVDERKLSELRRGTPDSTTSFHLPDEEPHVERLRRLIEAQYVEHPTGTGASFGEILCHEVHENGMTFAWLAEKWGPSLAMLGDLIADHCRRLEAAPVVDHDYTRLPRGAGYR